MTVAMALRAYRVAYVVYLSGKTFLAADRLAAGAASQHGHLGHLVTPAFLQALSAAEIAAAAAFLVRRIEGYAGAALLAIYAIAGGLDVALGEVPAPLLFYAANVALFLAIRKAEATAPA